MANLEASPVTAAPGLESWRYCGRAFTAAEMAWIRTLGAFPKSGRAACPATVAPPGLGTYRRHIPGAHAPGY